MQRALDPIERFVNIVQGVLGRHAVVAGDERAVVVEIDPFVSAGADELPGQLLIAVEAIIKPLDRIGSAKNTIRFLCWTFAWSMTMVLADKAILYEWHSSALISAIAIVLNAVIGIGMILSYLRHLKYMDELQRKIQLDALAISMGVALVGSFSYSLMVTAKFITDAEVSDIILLMSFTFVVSVIVGHLRYR